MSIKLLGAVFVLTGSGSCGFLMAAAQRREERELRQLVRGLEYMECELQFHQTPLPQLCRLVSGVTGGAVQGVFYALAEELDKQTEPEPSGCMELAVRQFPGLCPQVQELFRSLGQSLGRFDLPGQLRGLASVKTDCSIRISALADGRESRLRSYQTLGLCTGAALAILFM